MGKLFTFCRNQMMILVALLFVQVASAAYIFVYIPGNKKDVDERRFRTVRTIEENVRGKMENSLGLLNNLIDAYQNKDPNYDQNQLSGYYYYLTAELENANGFYQCANIHWPKAKNGCKP